jgi:hypothetical protein
MNNVVNLKTHDTLRDMLAEAESKYGDFRHAIVIVFDRNKDTDDSMHVLCYTDSQEMSLAAVRLIGIVNERG